MRVRRRRRLVLAFLAAALPVAVGSAAFACQQLATLHANPNSASVGVNVTVSGAGFSESSAASAIVIRLDSRVGPVLASVPRADGGTFEVTFAVPRSASVGYHTFLATQEVNGQLAFVARAVFQVLPAPGPATANQNFAPERNSTFSSAFRGLFVLRVPHAK